MFDRYFNIMNYNNTWYKNTNSIENSNLMNMEYLSKLHRCFDAVDWCCFELANQVLASGIEEYVALQMKKKKYMQPEVLVSATE